MTSFISEAYKKDAQQTLRLLREVFTREAVQTCSLKGTELLKAALDLDVTQWEGTRTVGIWNRVTKTENNALFDMSVPQFTFLGNLLEDCGVHRIVIFGDTLADAPKAAVGKLAVEVVDLTEFWKREDFKRCFGDGVVDFSAQCYIQLELQNFVDLNLGPHSGGTDYLGFMGSPVIFWTSTDHPAHPRMPRLTEYCSRWWCVPVGSWENIKAAREEGGFPETGERLLTTAIQYALSATASAESALLCAARWASLCG